MLSLSLELFHSIDLDTDFLIIIIVCSALHSSGSVFLYPIGATVNQQQCR